MYPYSKFCHLDLELHSHKLGRWSLAHLVLLDWIQYKEQCYHHKKLQSFQYVQHNIQQRHRVSDYSRVLHKNL